MVRLKFDLRRISRALQADAAALDRELPRAMQRHGARFEREMQDRQLTGVQLEGPWRRNPGTNGVARRTGSLARSIRTAVEGQGIRVVLSATIGDAVTAPYAQIQEEGGTVRPRRARYLAIPAPANLTPSGVPRYPSPRALMNDPENPTLIAPTGSGGIGIYRKRADGEAELLWILKREVKIPARLGFARTFSGKRMDRDRVRRFTAAVERAFGIPGGGEAVG